MSSTISPSHEQAHAHGGPAVYTRNLIALLILTGLTIGAAFIDLGSGNVVVALAIASIKASLVALFFMHLRWDKSVNSIIAVAGFLFLGIFLMFDFLDVGTRADPSPLNIPQMTEEQAPTPVPQTMNPLLTPPPKPAPLTLPPDESVEPPTPAESGEGGIKVNQ